MARKPETNTVINGHAYYRLTRTIGHRIVNGEKVPIKKQFLGSSKTAAENKYKAFLEEQARAQYEQKQRLETITLGELADDYIENVFKPSSKYTPSTKDRYERAYRQFFAGSVLSGLLLEDVSVDTLQSYYNKLDCTKTGLEALHKFLRLLFGHLVVKGLFPANITAAVEMPEKPYTQMHEEIVVWSEDDLKKLLRDADSPRYRLMVYVFAYAGLRIGEIMGLKRTDIRDGEIHISRQITDGVLKAPKYGSMRNVPLHPAIAAELPAHIEWQDREMQEMGYETDFLFTTSTGKPYDRSTLRKSLYRMYDRIGVPRRHPHAFRATFCTQMCRCDVPLEVTSKLLGHKSLEVTAAHYALVKTDTQQDAIKRLKY